MYVELPGSTPVTDGSNIGINRTVQIMSRGMDSKRSKLLLADGKSKIDS